jgi:riboflavin biosynthesis pyrimidine reductase
MSSTTLTDPELNRDRLVERYGVSDRSVPRTRVNFISSLDGAATHDGLSGGLNNPADKVVFDTLRMLSDVVVVGAGTIRAEGYGDIRLEPDAAAWRRSEGLVEQPAIAIVSSNLDIAPTHPIFATTNPRPMVITHAASPVDRRTALAQVAEVLVCGEEAVDIRLMVETLTAAGYPQILCEGGPHLLGALIEADCVDEFCLTLSPVLEGGSAGRVAQGGAQATRRMALLDTFAVEDMLFLRYERRTSAEL